MVIVFLSVKVFKYCTRQRCIKNTALPGNSKPAEAGFTKLSYDTV